jgi:hypothetical protein
MAQVGWESGGLFDDSLVDTVVPFFRNSMHSQATGPRRDVVVAIPGSSAMRSWVVDADDTALWVTQVLCGRRRMNIITGGARADVEALHRRVAGSFRCRPDPTRERSVEDVPIVLDLGSSWRRFDNDNSKQVQLTDGKYLVIAQALTPTPDEMVPTLASAFPGMHVGVRNDDGWSMEMDLHGQKGAGWVRLHACPEWNVSVLLMCLSISAGAGRCPADPLHAECRKLGEPPQTWKYLPRRH